MKILFLCVFVFFSGAILAQDCKGYLPYDEGTTWEVTNYSAKGKELSKTAFELAMLSKIDGGLKYTVKMISYDDKGKEVFANSFDSFCKNGKFSIDMSRFLTGSSAEMFGGAEVEMDATEMEMPDMDTPAGTQLKDASLTVKMSGGVGLSMTINVTDRKVVSKEKVETSAGSFDCIVLTQDVSTKMMIKIIASSKEWYAEGIGMVASESYNKKGKLTGSSKLTSFNKK